MSVVQLNDQANEMRGDQRNEQTNEKGFVIVCTGHPYYARMAYNLCVSIKAADRDTKVALLYNGDVLSHLRDTQIGLFDHAIKLPDDVVATQSCKLFAHEYSPFEKTIVLDADMAWLPVRKPAELFAELDGSVYSGITEGSTEDVNPKYFFWADVEEIRSTYSVDFIYQWRTELMYFNNEGRSIMKRALAITQDPKMNSVKKFAYAVPDELGINISTAIAGVKPHKYKWQPSYWHLMYNGMFPSFDELYNNYYLLSCGSNHASGTLTKMYDRVIGYAFNQMGLQHVFPLISKRSFLKERDKM